VVPQPQDQGDPAAVSLPAMTSVRWTVVVLLLFAITINDIDRFHLLLPRLEVMALEPS
jgi:hypothetical protein